jgi:hypothetical protein
MRKIGYFLFARPGAYYLQPFTPFCSQAGKLLERSGELFRKLGKLSEGLAE